MHSLPETRDDAGEHRPLLAIVYGDGSTSAMVLAEAAAPVCDIVWVVDSDRTSQKWMLRLVRKLGQTLDIASMSEEEAAAALGLLRPDGIVAYGEVQLETASVLATRLGLDYHNPTVAGRLRDKVRQRQALADGGLPVPRCVVVPSPAREDEIDALIDGVTFPVVLKPRHGAASRETHLVTDGVHLRKLIDELPSGGAEPFMVVEEYMAGATPPPSPMFYDYVSVESVVARGQISHVAVTGRLHPAEPFRETGLVVPSDYPPSVVADVLHVASEAIEALGVRTGCLHTEIKMTDKGLRVLEVNGRLGGFVPEVVGRAAPGVNLYEISQRVAVGEQVTFDGPVPTEHVGYVVVRQPPQWARRVTGVEGLDRVASYPGVDAVSLARPPGEEVDWRRGSHEYVFSVLGAAADYEGVQALEEFIDNEVTVSYE